MAPNPAPEPGRRRVPGKGCCLRSALPSAARKSRLGPAGSGRGREPGGGGRRSSPAGSQKLSKPARDWGVGEPRRGGGSERGAAGRTPPLGSPRCAPLPPRSLGESTVHRDLWAGVLSAARYGARRAGFRGQRKWGEPGCPAPSAPRFGGASLRTPWGAGGRVKRGALSLAAPSLGFQTTREPLLLAAWLLDPFPPPPPPSMAFPGPFPASEAEGRPSIPRPAVLHPGKPRHFRTPQCRP